MGWRRRSTPNQELSTKTDPTLAADQRLMRRVAAGSVEAKQELVERLYRRVRGRVGYLCSNDVEAEDLTQDTLIQILQAAERFRADGCVEAWADVITVRTVTRTMSRIRRLRKLLGGAVFEPAASTGNPEHRLGEQQRSERIYKLLSKIPAQWREAVILKLMYGYSAREVAELTDQPLKKVQYHIKRGRAALRGLVLNDEQLREQLPEVVA